MHKVSVNEGEENRADDNGEFISPLRQPPVMIPLKANSSIRAGMAAA